ncbi:MAG: hypothetical protein HZB51_15330 [Chloroflexi bacterium]|nr:hypothetical protein [Chloroflexota bacterium]
MSDVRCWIEGTKCNKLQTSNFQRLTSNLQSESGVSYVIAAIFLGVVLGPILALSIEIGRYAETRVLIQQAADLAALAAAQEADVATFQETGNEILLTGNAQRVAQDYINRNLVLAAGHAVTAQVRSIEIEGNSVTANVDADVSELFPKFVGHVTIHVTGLAEMRFTRDGQRAR